MKHIYQIYLYSVSLLALIALVISGSILLNLVLKGFIFTKADRYESSPAIMYAPTKYPDGSTTALYPDIKCTEKDTKCLETQQEILRNLQEQQAQYKKWEENQKVFWNVQRQSQAADALAFFLVSLPIYLIHWRLVKKNRLQEEKI